MEPRFEASRLRRRQAELEDAMRRPGGVRVIEERELIAVRAALKVLQQNEPSPSAESAAPAVDGSVRIRTGAGHE